MIEFLTGAPGAGKSAEMVRRIREAVKAGRKVYVDGVPDLAIEHEAFEPARWHEPGQVQDGSFLVVDEAQRVWRPRAAGAAVPASIAAMETHRHRGLDILIVTQAPALVDANIRRLCGRHVHIRNVGVLGRWWYEWPECGNVEAFRTAPIKRRYRLPREVFALYKSASVHVKTKATIPPALIVLGLAVVVCLFLAWRIYQSFQDKLGPSEAAPGAAPAAQGATQAYAPRAAPGGPRLEVAAPVKDREPFAGLAVHLAGEVHEGAKVSRWFTVTHQGRPVGQLTDRQVYAAGYAYRSHGPCFGVLVFNGRERVVWCDTPHQAAPREAAAAARAASGAL